MDNDFSAYAMLSGWGTKGKLVCPHCMEDTKAFILKHESIGVVGLTVIDDFCHPIIFSGGVRGDS